MWRRQPRMYGLTLKRRACLNPDYPALNGIEMSFRLAPLLGTWRHRHA